MNNKKYKTPTIEKDPSTMATYKTADLYLSAFLKSKEVILQSINEKNGKVLFVFQDKGDIQDLINEYFNDSNVKVLRFKASLGDLRSIIFDCQNFRKKYRDKRNK